MDFKSARRTASEIDKSAGGTASSADCECAIKAMMVRRYMERHCPRSESALSKRAKTVSRHAERHYADQRNEFIKIGENSKSACRTALQLLSELPK